MATLPSLFEDLLTNIEPDANAKEHAQKAHSPIREHLKNDEEFGKFFEDSFLYGSYKRQTTIGAIKDIDIGVITNFDPSDPENTPKKVLFKLKKAINKHYNDEYEEADNTEYQRKSILVKDPLPDNPEIKMTLDILPAIAPNGIDGILLVPDRELSKWVNSHPKAHLKNATDLNFRSNGMYIPLVKIMKYWWSLNSGHKAKPKGFWIESLTGVYFDRSIETYAEHFVAVLERISTKFINYERFTKVPELLDPGMPTETIKTKMTLIEFQRFMGKVKSTLIAAKAALEEDNELESSKKWEKIFGNYFPIYEKKSEAYIDDLNSLDNALATQVMEFDREHIGLSLQDYSHKLQPQWRENLQPELYVRIDEAYAGRRKISSDKKCIVASYLPLEFIASTNVSKPYDVRWQIVNTGDDVKDDPNAKRGWFEESNEGLIKKETTQYNGVHWIECFIIKNNELVARSGCFYVNIFNSRTNKFYRQYLGRKK